MCEAFGVTMSQLFAEGEERAELTPKQRDALDKWNKLSPAQQESLSALMDSMLE